MYMYVYIIFLKILRILFGNDCRLDQLHTRCLTLYQQNIIHAYSQLKRNFHMHLRSDRQRI